MNSRRYINILLLLSAASFVFGVCAPFMTVSKFIVVDNTVSILSGIQGLYQEGDWFLFILIGGFSVLTPIVKLTLLSYVNNTVSPSAPRYAQFVEKYSKWSMLDVFVAAVLVVTLKLGSIVDVTIHYGIYLFSFSIVLSMIASSLVQRKMREQTTDTERF